jgi:hypothetical protein
MDRYLLGIRIDDITVRQRNLRGKSHCRCRQNASVFQVRFARHHCKLDDRDDALTVGTGVEKRVEMKGVL